MPSVVAIVVTFNPDTEVLNVLVKAIEPQVNSVIVVDNGALQDTTGGQNWKNA